MEAERWKMIWKGNRTAQVYFSKLFYGRSKRPVDVVHNSAYSLNLAVTETLNLAFLWLYWELDKWEAETSLEFNWKVKKWNYQGGFFFQIFYFNRH